MSIELRLDIDERTAGLLDACCQAAPGLSRAALVRRVLDEWAEREIRRASLIVRVCGVHGNDSDGGRKRGGG